MKKTIYGSFLLFLLLTCSQEQKSTQKYFDFTGLIEDQVSQLSQRCRVLDKTAAMGDEKSDSTFLPSLSGWATELEIFRDLELINKPTFKGEYVITDPLDDTKSNLKIREYAATTAPVPSIKFYYQDQFERLRKIEAAVTERNLLYSTRRILVMEFDEEDGKPLLIRYSMTGLQKMVFSDTLRFSVIGQINW